MCMAARIKSKLLSLGVLSVFTVMITMFGLTLCGSQARTDNQRIRDRLIGGWRLAGLEEPDANGEVHKADCTGLLIYTRDGHMSVQVMYRNPQPETNARPVQYAQGGYGPPMAPIRLTPTLTPSPSTLRARWCGHC